jgi:signal transduction histidine kinase
MLAELLEQGEVAPEERAEIEQTLAGETRRLGATLDRMLRFGALARGKLVAANKRCLLAPIGRDAATRFRTAHPDKLVVVEADEALEDDVDAGLVGLALDNLLSNAAKYAPEGVPFRLSIRRRRSRLVPRLPPSPSSLSPGSDARIARHRSRRALDRRHPRATWLVVYVDEQTILPERYAHWLAVPIADIKASLDRNEGFVAVKERPGTPRS